MAEGLAAVLQQETADHHHDREHQQPGAQQCQPEEAVGATRSSGAPAGSVDLTARFGEMVKRTTRIDRVQPAAVLAARDAHRLPGQTQQPLFEPLHRKGTRITVGKGINRLRDTPVVGREKSPHHRPSRIGMRSSIQTSSLDGHRLEPRLGHRVRLFQRSPTDVLRLTHFGIRQRNNGQRTHAPTLHRGLNEQPHQSS
ncbi:hypothetical protein ACWEOE_13755 [Amycolatopsis sp. NPDC004368]